MAYRDFDDGLKMPAGTKKPANSGGNVRPAAPNGGNTGGSRKPAGSNGYSRPASANGYEAGSYKKTARSYGSARPASANGYETGGYKKPAGPTGSARPAVPVKSVQGNPPSRYHGLIKALIAVFCVLVAGVVAIGVYFVTRWKDDDYSSLQSGLVVLAPDAETAKDPNAGVIAVAAEPTPASNDSTIVYNGQTYVKNQNIVNLLFLGIDTNADRKKNMRGYRSDMLMVCAVDIAAKKATLISIPRDTYTTMYKLDENTGEVKETVQDKINAAYAYGGGASRYSYANAMACVEMFLERRCELEHPLGFELDIPVYLYAGIDMDGITQVASAVGGVEVTLSESVPEVERARR